MKKHFSLGIQLIIIILISILSLLFFPGLLYSDILKPETGNYKDTYSIFSDSDSKPIYDDFIDIEATNALLMDAGSGTILWGKNENQKVYPASITKIMTGILAIEHIDDFNKIVEISENASGVNHSAFFFDKGDRITLMDLLKSALIVSHNNATIALAEYISGNTGNFIAMMNQKAVELGANNTNFENTNGLDSKFPDHITTAYDIALISKYAMENELFREIVSTPTDIIMLNDDEIGLENTNKLLTYDYIKGIKTGYTENAGFCLAAFSDLNGMELITVILNSGVNTRERDALNLIYWADNNIKTVKLVDSQIPLESIEVGTDTRVSIDLYASEDISRMIHLTNNHIELEHSLEPAGSLPLSKNTVMGDVTVTVNDIEIGTVPLVNAAGIDKPHIYQDISGKMSRQKIITIACLLAFYFLVIIFIIFKNLLIKKMRY
jgi:D-alanyl-D-alanine carboxypeptidase (penicillin-binding protein 5/6)